MLQIRYMLAKFVFPALEYNGWTASTSQFNIRLNAHELHKKAEYMKELTWGPEQKFRLIHNKQMCSSLVRS